MPAGSWRHGIYFNPLHHEGGDCPSVWCNTSKSISIHSTTRVETKSAFPPLTIQFLFQSTPPRGWRQISVMTTSGLYSNFNPLHHEGGDHVPDVLQGIVQISIHSTTRVETTSCSPPTPSPWYFNPLHHEGGDELSLLRGDCMGISIHSTTRVETRRGICNRRGF